jgi:VanZ family protein
MKRFLRYWLPLLLWMVLIFAASQDTKSVEHTSRLLEPFLRWIKPDISPEAIEQVRWMIRKAAHMTEFAVLAGLLWRALARMNDQENNRWFLRPAAASLGFCIFFAASDEIHQSFVPNRTGTPKDVLIDTAGAGIGLLIATAVKSRRRRVAT